jgi:hypothetical protein
VTVRDHHIDSTLQAEQDTERLRRQVVELGELAIQRLKEDLGPNASIAQRNAAISKIVPYLFKNIEARDTESAAMKKMKGDWNELVALMSDAPDSTTEIIAADTSMVDAPALPDIAHPTE